jgi:hypothetical protein
MQNQPGHESGDFGQGGDDPSGTSRASNGPNEGQWQAITEDEASEIGALGSEDDDPEGWMSERMAYWESLPPAAPPTREAWLRSVIANATTHLAALMARKAGPWQTRESDSVWANLANDALGLPRTTRLETVNPNRIKQAPRNGDDPECELVPA